ncbi:MAG: hypothetical protein HYR85_27800 [Planctomycetes bacterium]|nr:hypothetical protein [Planctomycetota bacterium]MBI3844214.1 hypothetical protein [Planctomycetota bacterium]
MNAKWVGFAIVISSLVATMASAQNLSQRFIVNDLRGNYAVDGVGLFGSGAGNISINTVPTSPGTAVKSAYLYWDVLGDGSGPPAGANVGIFMGNSIAGTLIGSGNQLDQAQTNNYSYWADVTTSIPIPGGNGLYTLSGFSTATEGASLVFIWVSLPFANRDIIVMDGDATINAANPSVTTTLTGFDATSPVTGAAVAFIVSDGQVSLPDSTTFGTSGLFNSTLDGSTPPVGLELWDNDNYTTQASNVPAGSTSVSATITRPDNGDSVAWVATPFSVTSPYPVADVTLTPQVRVVVRGNQFTTQIHLECRSSSNVAVTGQIEVYDNRGNLLGLMAGPTNGILRPGTVIDQPFRRRIPATGVPGRLIGVPLRVVIKILQRGTTTVIDDDYVEFVIQ